MAQEITATSVRTVVKSFRDYMILPPTMPIVQPINITVNLVNNLYKFMPKMKIAL